MRTTLLSTGIALSLLVLPVAYAEEDVLADFPIPSSCTAETANWGRCLSDVIPIMTRQRHAFTQQQRAERREWEKDHVRLGVSAEGLRLKREFIREQNLELRAFIDLQREQKKELQARYGTSRVPERKPEVNEAVERRRAERLSRAQDGCEQYKAENGSDDNERYRTCVRFLRHPGYDTIRSRRVVPVGSTEEN